MTNYHLQAEGIDNKDKIPEEVLVLEEELDLWSEEMYEAWAKTNTPTMTR